ncbi:MAG: DNA polymerase III subunit delta' [Pseudomonadota bacterium]|mgnify:FL=1
MNNIYIWQAAVWRMLTQGPAARGHALLLKGRKGVGKLVFARNLAKSLLCEKPSADAEACGSCPSCGWFEQGGHPDFRLVEPEALTALADEAMAEAGGDADTGAETGPASTKGKKKSSKQIGVEQIRALSDLVHMSSHRNGYKIILIHPAETMNLAAANALLKNLEEPPPQTLFILVTHRPQDLLPTIRSRCRQIAMPTPDLATAVAWLKQQGVKDPATSLAAAGYAPLAALEFDDDDYLAQHEAFIRQIGTPGGFNPIVLAEEMQKSDLPTAVNWMQKWCYDLMSFRTTGKIRYHLPMLATIKSLVSEIDPRALAAYSRSLISTQRLARHPLNPRLFLEEMLLSYAVLIAPARSKRAD